MSLPLYVDPSPQRGRVEVGLAARRDVECAAPERDETLVDELRLAVDEDRSLRADRRRTCRDRVDVRLVGLAEVGRERVGQRPLLADPRDRDGRVEPAGERDADAFADGERGQDARHGREPSPLGLSIDRHEIGTART